MADTNEKGTVYQKLNKFFNFDGFGFAPSAMQEPQTNILIKGNSAEEIKRKALELEQKKELQNKFFRTTDRGFQKALQYEAARLPAYIDYEGMEYYPIISSALDLFMEEATTIGENGKMLNIYSSKDRIKSILDEFFYDIVNVNVNLPFWVRNLPIKHDSIIPLLDGTEITIKEISERLKNNPENEIWTYSIQDDTKNVLPGKVIWCDLTRKNSQIVRVNLDDNTYVETTPDHEFMLRNGSFVKACDLNAGDSLMPYYTMESKEGSLIKGYEKVYNPSSNHHKYTHRLVSQELLRNVDFEKNLLKKYVDDNIITHHKDFNKKNNHPQNLVRMLNSEHSKLHGYLISEILQREDVVEKRMKGIDKYLRSDKRKKYLSKLMKGKYSKFFEEYNNSELHNQHNEIRSKSMLNYWSNEEYKNKVSNLMQVNLTDNNLETINDYIKEFGYLGKNKFCELLKNNKDFMGEFTRNNSQIKRDKNKSINGRTLNSMLLRKVGLSYIDYIAVINESIKNNKNYQKSIKVRNSRKENKIQKAEPVLNHKVVSVEYLDKKEDVYCMEVVGNNNEEDRHNFPICSKGENGEYSRNGVFVSNCKYGDNFVLIYGERKTGITHVKQMVNYEIERFERIQNGKPSVMFKERMTGDEFNVFEVAHFRLLGDDKFLPYGNSILNKVRRVFRQCLDSESEIWTPEGYTKIKDINVDDNVFSYSLENHKYFPTKVSNVSNNGIKERYEIKTHHRNIIVTDDHPILTYNNDHYEYKDILNINISKDKLVLPSIDEGKTDHKILQPALNYYAKLNSVGIDFVKSIDSDGIMGRIRKFNTHTTEKNIHAFLRGYDKKIRYDDLLKIGNEFQISSEMFDLYSFGRKNKAIVNKNLEYEINEDFIKFFGFMLGDGWLNYHTKTVGFALGEYNNQNEEYIELAKRLSGVEPKITNHNNSKSSSAIINSYEFFKIIESFGFVTGFDNKIIPNWVYSLPKSWKLIFIRAMFDADGCDNNGNYSSSNKGLISDLRRLSQTCNLKVGNVLPAKRKGIEWSKSINGKEIYTLYIKFKEETPDVDYQKILSIENIGEGEVWDIEIDNVEHNFISNGLVVHNCVMAEDAMLTYRIIRAGEKKVFKIDVGNIDEEDVEDYIYKVATKFKKTAQVQPNDGQIDYRFNILGNDEDYFLPIRNANVQTGIDTLPGAQNLDQIQDLEYLRDNLFTGLGIPKPFLSFQDAQGGGKNMAQYDIRFAKKVNRIQQSIIQELNKMAMVHLYLLGYSKEDLNDFTLTLTNPSTQQDLMKAQLLREKAQTYTELTRGENGIAAMSHTEAKRRIFNMSNKEIVEDLKQQKMEKVVQQELADAPVIIKHTGLFADIDNKYGDEELVDAGGGTTGNTEQGGMPPEGGLEGDIGDGPQANVPFATPAELPPVVGDGVVKTKPILENGYNDYVEKMIFGDEVFKKEKKKELLKENVDENDKLNTKATNMVKEIDELLETSNKLNEFKEIEVGDFNLDELEDIDFEEKKE